MVGTLADDVAIADDDRTHRDFAACCGLPRQSQGPAHEADVVLVYSHSMVAGGLPEMS